MCNKHYCAWRAKHPDFDSVRIKSRSFPVYEVDGELRRQCQDCNNHFPISQFGKRKISKYGIGTYCKMCANERGELSIDENTRRRASEMRSRRQKINLRWADRKYAAWINTPHNKSVPIDVAAKWTDHLFAIHDTMNEVSSVTGVDKRKLYDINKRTFMSVSIDVAERLATEAGFLDEFEQYDVPHGVDGWNRQGDRFCQRCGTCWHYHLGLGMCSACYRAYRRQLVDGIYKPTAREKMMDFSRVT